MKRLILFLPLILLTIILTGCEVETAPVATNLPVLNNDIQDGTLVRQFQVDNVSMEALYSTTYDTKHWRITDSKNLNIQLTVQGKSDKTILLEHMHVDIGLKSKYASLDGWSQDSMDDSIHGGLQPGFLITPTAPYNEVFAIEGFSQMLISGWSYFSNGTGYGTITEQRLTEDHLVQLGGVYGNKVQVVFDFAIKSPGDEYWHTSSVINEFLVPTGN